MQNRLGGSGPLVYAIKDEAIHLGFGLLVSLPLIAAHGLKLLGFVLVFAVLIDLDHVIAARSFSIRRLITLSERPAGHSVSFALIAGLAIFIVLETPVYAWIAFASVLSHAMVDSADDIGSPILWPFAENVRITEAQRMLGIMLLLLGSVALAVTTA
jgi:membrane-bound metal-dependent hydrolase YbcI (DUF457 family)